MIVKANRENLLPHLGKIVSFVVGADEEDPSPSGELVLVCDGYFAIADNKDGSGGSILSQLEHITNPVYTVSEETNCIWRSYFGNVTVTIHSELSAQNKPIELNAQHGQAAWGTKDHKPPPGAAFEFL